MEKYVRSRKPYQTRLQLRKRDEALSASGPSEVNQVKPPIQNNTEHATGPEAAVSSGPTPHADGVPEGCAAWETWDDVLRANACNVDVDVASLPKDQVELVLRMFDFNPQYGPFVGIPRLERWHRAQQWGADPPLLVRRILESAIAVPQREHGRLF